MLLINVWCRIRIKIRGGFWFIAILLFLAFNFNPFISSVTLRCVNICFWILKRSSENIFRSINKKYVKVSFRRMYLFTEFFKFQNNLGVKMLSISILFNNWITHHITAFEALLWLL